MNTTTENIRVRATEQALIERIQQGDIDAFSKLYDKYAPVLHGVILKIAIDKNTAEAILQKSFMRLWMEISSFDPLKESLLMWMLSITRNTAFSTIAQKNQTEGIRTADNSVHTSNPGITPANTATVIDPPHDEPATSAIEMVYFKGYSLTRASHELNLTVAVLKTRIRMELKMHGGIKSNG